MFERRKAKKLIEEKMNMVQMNLENNYKDLTISSRKEAEEVLNEYRQKGILKEKDLLLYERRLEEFDRKMQHYGHANISEFLKERY